MMGQAFNRWAEGIGTDALFRYGRQTTQQTWAGAGPPAQGGKIYGIFSTAAINRSSDPRGGLSVPDLGIWGAINLLERFTATKNPGAKSQGA
jgi:hypothetical protein